MNDRTYTFEEIAAYLAGELSEKERANFVQQIEQDEALAAQVEQQRLTHQAVDLYTQLRTKEEIKAIYKNIAQARRRPRRTILAVAASIAILVVAGFLWQQSQQTTDLLASEYLTPYPDRLTNMSDDSGAQITAAMTAYNGGDYANAIPLFEALPDSLAQGELINLYLGISRLQEDQAGAAQASFANISSDSPYQEAAQWYLALSELALGKEKAARERLEAIVAAGNYPGPTAQELLDRLNN